MEKVQATLEFSLRIKQFQNLLRPPYYGCWQIKTSFETLTKIPHTVEARIFHTEDNVTHPASVEGSTFFSSEFILNTTTRTARIDDVVIFTINILLNESQIEETLNALESKMTFDIYSAENHEGLSRCKSRAPNCSEDMKLHFNLHRGIHSHANIIFETCSKVSVMVHGLLVGLQPPQKSFSKKNSVFQRIFHSRWTKTKIPSLESVIFGKKFKKRLAADGKSFVIKEKYMQHAYQFLSTLQSCLLLSYDGLYSYFMSLSETLPSSRKPELEKMDMNVRLSELSDKLTKIEGPNALAEGINDSLIEMSAQLLNLWGKFLQSSLESEHEKQKIKEEKFKKFFSTDHLRQEAILYDEKLVQSHKKIYMEVKNAPKDDLECRDMDKVSKSAPVIFEDRYCLECQDTKSKFAPVILEDQNLERDATDCSKDFIAMSSPLRKELLTVKKELMKFIVRSFSNNPCKEFNVSVKLDNGSNEGISVDIKMRAANYNKNQLAVITFVYGCLGGRTAVIGHLGDKDQTLAKYDSLINHLFSKIAKLIKSNRLIISRIRLYQELSEKNLVWERLIPTHNKSSSTGTKDNSSSEEGTHLIVCVHGLGGSQSNFCRVRPHIACGITEGNIDFLMSRRNQDNTNDNIDNLAKGLLNEILEHITSKKLIISRISFIGFSLGTLIIRTALSKPEFEGYLGNLHTYLSFGGPHMGLLYHRRFLYKTGLWVEKRLHTSVSVSQMAFSDHQDPRQRFLYKLSQKPGLEHFKNVILVNALQDYVVPHHSARIEMCKEAFKGDELGTVYCEMLQNILEPVLNNKNCNFVRYDVSFDLPNSLRTFTGFKGHCAFISSWQFLDNFFQNAGLKYFE